MKRLNLALGLLGLLVATPSLSAEITVWDWKSGDPLNAAYYDSVKKNFEAAHPGTTVNYVFQPHDQFYTLLGTALASGSGPDLIMLNAGAQLVARTDALVPLDTAVADLKSSISGWPDFSGTDGKIYAIPLSIQGFVAYYNKKIYADAGLDPEKPPTTWAELVKVCDAIKAKGNATCFSLGNKEGFGIELWFSSIAATEWTAQEQADFTAGKLKWSSPQVRAVLQSWVDANAAGWFPAGANSTPKFPDEYEGFMRGDSANSVGLISDVGNWKQFDDFMQPENVGAFRMPSPTIASDKKEGDPQFPVTGGIGYGVNKASKNVDLAIALDKEFAAPANQLIFFTDAGAIPANTAVDTSGLKSPSGKLIFGWMKTSEAPMAYSDATAREVEELHRQSQLLLNGTETIDQAVEQLDKVQAEARK